MIYYYLKGKSFISRAIQLVTKSSYSHIGIYLGNYTIAEALGRGVTIDFIHDLPQGYDIFRLKPEIMFTETQKNKLDDFILQKISTPYNYEKIFACLLEEELGIKIPVVKNRMICSEFAYLAYRYALGFDILPDIPDHEIITPEMISESEFLIKVC